MTMPPGEAAMRTIRIKKPRLEGVDMQALLAALRELPGVVVAEWARDASTPDDDVEEIDVVTREPEVFQAQAPSILTEMTTVKPRSECTGWAPRKEEAT